MAHAPVMYLPKSKMVYVAVPKTGGTSTANALRAYADPTTIYDTNDATIMHRPASYAKRMFPNADVVCVMREPIDWMFSKYRYLSSSLFSWDSVYTTRHQTFARFVTRYVRGEKPWPEPFRTQAEYIRGSDIVFRYDRMTDFEKFLSDRINVVINLSKMNVSPCRKFDLTDTMRKALCDVLSNDFDIWSRLSNNKSFAL